MPAGQWRDWRRPAAWRRRCTGRSRYVRPLPGAGRADPPGRRPGAARCQQEGAAGDSRDGAGQPGSAHALTGDPPGAHAGRRQCRAQGDHRGQSCPGPRHRGQEGRLVEARRERTDQHGTQDRPYGESTQPARATCRDSPEYHHPTHEQPPPAEGSRPHRAGGQDLSGPTVPRSAAASTRPAPEVGPFFRSSAHPWRRGQAVIRPYSPFLELRLAYAGLYGT